MRCPYCNSDDVIESEVSIFETDPFGMAPMEFDLFGIKTITRIIANSAKKIELSVNEKKRYCCRKCNRYFEA